MEEIFAHYDVNKLAKITKIDSRNFYKHNKDERIIRCLICEIDISEVDTFEHTVSLTHKYNKLFYNFVENRNRFGDTDFIISDVNWCKCRYCVNGFIRNHLAHRFNHARDITHVEKKRYCLDKVKAGCEKPSIVKAPILNASDTCVKTLAMPLLNHTAGVNNERQLVPKSQRKKKNKMKVEYLTQSTTNSIKDLAIAKHSTKASDSCIKVSALPLPKNTASVSNERELAVRAKVLNQKKTEIAIIAKPSGIGPKASGSCVKVSALPSPKTTASFNNERQVDEYEIHNLYSNDLYRHSYSHRASNKENLVPTWAWIGMGCAALAFTILRSK